MEQAEEGMYILNGVPIILQCGQQNQKDITIAPK